MTNSGSWNFSSLEQNSHLQKLRIHSWKSFCPREIYFAFTAFWSHLRYPIMYGYIFPMISLKFFKWVNRRIFIYPARNFSPNLGHICLGDLLLFLEWLRGLGSPWLGYNNKSKAVTLCRSGRGGRNLGWFGSSLGLESMTWGTEGTTLDRASWWPTHTTQPHHWQLVDNPRNITKLHQVYDVQPLHITTPPMT